MELDTIIWIVGIVCLVAIVAIIIGKSVKFSFKNLFKFSAEDNKKDNVDLKQIKKSDVAIKTRKNQDIKGEDISSSNIKIE